MNRYVDVSSKKNGRIGFINIEWAGLRMLVTHIV
jgi:hypothetical protein